MSFEVDEEDCPNFDRVGATRAIVFPTLTLGEKFNITITMIKLFNLNFCSKVWLAMIQICT